MASTTNVVLGVAALAGVAALVTCMRRPSAQKSPEKYRLTPDELRAREVRRQARMRELEGLLSRPRG